MSKVNEIITDRIIAKLEEGTAPWRKPWVGGSDGAPANFTSKKPYRGINTIMTGMQGYASRYWVTYKQAKQAGGSVKKGEKGTPLVFFKFLDSKSDPGKKIPLLRYYTVFNLSQCEGITVPDTVGLDATERPTPTPIAECDRIVKEWLSCPRIDHGGHMAAYSPSMDRIRMPDREDFHSSEEYYSTLFHEMGHSTGHESRLKRPGIMNPISFGNHSYSKEELVAEMSAAFLCGNTGIVDNTIDNSAAYLANWIKVLKGDPKLIVSAASQAQKAFDHITGNVITVSDTSPAQIEKAA